MSEDLASADVVEPFEPADDVEVAVEMVGGVGTAERVELCFADRSVGS